MKVTAVNTATLIYKSKDNLDVYQGLGTTKEKACDALLTKYNERRGAGSDDGYMLDFDHLKEHLDPEVEDFYGISEGWFIVYDILDVQS